MFITGRGVLELVFWLPTASSAQLFLTLHPVKSRWYLENAYNGSVNTIETPPMGLFAQESQFTSTLLPVANPYYNHKMLNE